MQAEETFTSLNGGGFGTSGGSTLSPLPLPFDFDVTKIKALAAQGKNSEADIRSAYELFSTGQTSGRAYGYATDIQRRFTPGLISTYGSSDIRTAAANYLDSVGLARLAQVVSPIPTPTPVNPDNNGEFFPLPVTPVNTATPVKNPFELLIDALPKLFGNAVYNPPLQQQSSGFTGVDQGVPLAEATGGSNIGTYIILAIVAIVGYFLYKRFAG